MINIDEEEALIKKVGGKFALTTLLQRRMVELNRGSPPLVRMEDENATLRAIVFQEILEDKIALAPREDVAYALAEEKERIESAAHVAPPPQEDDGEIYGSDIKKIKEQRIKELAQLLNPKK